MIQDWWDGIFLSRRISSGPSTVGTSARLYVGNLSYQAKTEELSALFTKYGAVRGVHIVKDRYTRKPKGFAFVEMANEKDAEKALALSGSAFLSRNITVSVAKSQGPQFRKRGSGQRPNPRRGGYGGPRGRDRNPQSSETRAPQNAPQNNETGG